MFRVRRQKISNDPVAVVNRFVDAANRHDADGIARCLHPDFESIQPVYPSRNFRGSDQVRRNWQSIFESEPGFRLSLVRASATDGTVWVELHGAGKDVEVAGVFIMGVEDELVRWARVYSAVIEQPAVVMDEGDKAPKVVAVPLDPQAEAEELRRMIEAGRVAAMGDAASAPAPAVTGSEEAGSEEAGSEEAAGAGAGELVGPASASDSDADAPATTTRLELIEGLSEGGGDAAPAPGSTDGDETAPAGATAAEVTGDGDSGAATTEAGSGDSDSDSPTEADFAPTPSETAGAEPSGGDTDATPGSTGGGDAPTDEPPTDEPPTAEVAETSGPGEPDGPDDKDDPIDQDTVARVPPAVAAVHALADADRGRQARESLAHADDEAATDGKDTTEPDPEPDAAPATELDDAARVRAAARAATSKAAGLSAPKPAGPGKGSGRRSGRGGKPPRRG